MTQKKILTVIGARPQIIKAAALSRAIQTHFSEQIEEILVHTGQHYDENMSAVFFEELGDGGCLLAQEVLVARCHDDG